MESMTPPNAQPVIVRFRDDLRLADNPALTAAITRGSPLIAVYILDDETPGSWRLGGAARWWLHHSLAALGKNIERLAGALVLRRGGPVVAIKSLIQETRVPEIAALPNAYIHKPWAAPEAVRLVARIEMDTHYPAPIVDHAMARRRALNAFARLKSMRS